jgi:hypothetical protein
VPVGDVHFHQATFNDRHRYGAVTTGQGFARALLRLSIIVNMNAAMIDRIVDVFIYLSTSNTERLVKCVENAAY